MGIRNPYVVVTTTTAGTETPTTPQGNFGTRAWMAPEIYFNRDFCGLQADLWSAAICLYNMLTNQVLYHIPLPVDISFRYFLLARGLSDQPVNERTVEVLMDLNRPGVTNNNGPQQELLRKAIAHLNMSPEAMEVLQNLLEISPSQRWTLAQAMESDFCTMAFDNAY